MAIGVDECRALELKVPTEHVAVAVAVHVHDHVNASQSRKHA